MVTLRRPRGVIVIGASAGGLAALQDVVGGLPASIAAAVLIVVHFPPSERSHLSEILTRLGSLPAAEATDGAVLAEGRIYTAPSGIRHMVVDDDLVHLVEGPREHFARPAVDPLFRTAALAFGRRAIGVVLSGTNCDGTLGLREVKRLGGQSIVQTPDDARYPGMPTSALRDGEVDACVPASEMGPLLASLVADFDGPAHGDGDDLPHAAWSMAPSRARREGIDAPPMPGAPSMKVDRELLLPPLLPDIVVTRSPQSQQTWERAVRSRDAARPAYDAAITLLVAVWEHAPADAPSRARARVVRDAIATETCAFWWACEGDTIFLPFELSHITAVGLAAGILAGGHPSVDTCDRRYRARMRWWRAHALRRSDARA